MSVESHDLGPISDLTALSGYGDSYVVPGDEVYVVAEDCDYIYLNSGSNPVADGFNVIKAIFLPGVWQRRSSGGGAGALRFNTVAVGALGSGRLIDVALAGLVDGTSLAWVESVKDTWRWDATSVLTADNITVANPTANGVNPGRFIRELNPAPEWMTQLTWVIDPAGLTATPSDENSGAVGFPLATDAERQRRMGYNPTWYAGAYHLRYVSNVPVADPVIITGTLSTGTSTMIFCHGSLVDGQGQSTFFGPATVGTVTALNYATNTPWSFTCAAVPVSWTASALINLRGRVTASGVPANVGGTFWPIKDLGGAAPNAAARIAEPSVAAPTGYVIPFASQQRNTFTPTAGDTFVVETLTTIGSMSIQIFGLNATATNGNSVVLESLSVTTLTNQTNVTFVTLDGCIISNMASNPIPALMGILGCQLAPFAFPRAQNIVFVNGYCRGNSIEITTIAAMSFTRFMSQGRILRLTCLTPPNLAGQVGILINQFGICDAGATVALIIRNNVCLQATATLWGPGNTAEAIRLESNGLLAYGASSAALPNSYFFISNGGNWLSCEARISVPAFDVATSLWTAPRALSQANLQATVAAGGFGGQVNDPVTACVFDQIST
jgi:hypothetical protein